jgi:5-methyltetrahydrofolate--homocysteine methyltransferase
LSDFRERLASGDLIVFDGATGTELLRRGLEPGVRWNEERPEVVEEIHRAYRDAGAEVILTNTFAANRLHLQRAGQTEKVALYNRLGVELARRAGEGFVAGDMTSTGEFLEPYGSLTADDATNAFREQAQCLDRAGVDLFIIETMTDAREIALAVKAVRSVSDKLVIASMAFDETRGGYRTMTGATIEQAAEIMVESGAEVVGINCGSLRLDEAARVIAELRRCVSLPLIAQPNAGKPVLEEGRVVYRLGPDEFAEGMRRIVAAGARLVGGCCGTTPQHIAALCRALGRSMPH